MATLTGLLVKNSYKDLLTISGVTANEGITSSSKQIFDGDGIGSPVWMSTSLLQVGTSSSDADLTVYGDVKAKAYKMINPSGDTEAVFTMDNSSNLNVIPDLITKGAVTFKDPTGSSPDLVMDAEKGTFDLGDGSKGNVKLEDTSVKLQKGSTELLEVKEDGTFKIQSVSELPATPAAGDIVNYNGTINIGIVT